MQRTEHLGTVILRWVKLAALLYMFFIAVKLMGHSFSGMGKDHVRDMLSQATRNPFSGLLIGVLSTALIQSSSTTTAMVVGFVSGGVLNMGNAIPIIMGANIGTTVTNLLVSFGHIRNKTDFHRAYEVAIVHDVFNIFVVILLLPLEIYTHYLQRTSLWLADLLVGNAGVSFQSPLNMILKPTVALIDRLLVGGAGQYAGSIIMLILALIMLLASLVLIVKTMKGLVGQKIEHALNTILVKHGSLGIVLGAGITAIIQSSALTTALLVSLAGAGLVTIEAAFPITLGANLGTTVTALLASLAGNPMGLAIALAHLLFNLTGTLIFYPLKAMRRIPIGAAKYVAELAHRKWYYAFGLMITIFFIIPLLGMWLTD